MKRYLAAWWRLSRVPFLSVGILPLFLGFILAWRWGYRGPIGLYLLATVAVILIMWMTYYLSEWNDLEGDRLNRNFSPFSGGSRILVEGLFPLQVALFLGYGCLVGAILTGIYLYFGYQTGPWTLLLGGVGIFSGFFYSGRPFQWAYRGLGEIFIGFCYGWLPIASGFYLVAGFFNAQLFLLSLPVGLSIFNVILINEFPDEEADRAIGKKNLVVRFGKERMGDLYMGSSILVGLSFIKVLLIFGKGPLWLLSLAGIPLLLILWNLFQCWQGVNGEMNRMKRLCRNTLLINLSITMILTIQQTLI
ncbi:MAG: prenyltransferase [Thermodesulfobacteriota bacterium]|nr:prenyltransferase [Thermodesulfobacteriota bacterium]